MSHKPTKHVESKLHGLFDDLLDGETAARLGLSRNALQDLEKLDAAMRRGAAPRLETGKAVAVVQFIQTLRCECGLSYEVPEYQSMMLKRCFTGGTMRVIYTPLTSRAAFPELPRRIETQEHKIFTCHNCFTKLPIAQETTQELCCIYCHGYHSLDICKAEGHEEYRRTLVQERQDFRLGSSFNVHGAETGRFSATEQNEANVPQEDSNANLA